MTVEGVSIVPSYRCDCIVGQYCTVTSSLWLDILSDLTNIQALFYIHDHVTRTIITAEHWLKLDDNRDTLIEIVTRFMKQ